MPLGHIEPYLTGMENGILNGTVGYWSGSRWISVTTFATKVFPANVQGE